jgi:hypothetical protein
LQVVEVVVLQMVAVVEAEQEVLEWLTYQCQHLKLHL